MINVPITKNDGGQRLDRFMRKYLRNASLSMIYRMIRKDVKVNGKRAHIETELKEGDVLSIYISQEELEALTGGRKKTAHVKKQFHIVFEDDNILVADKPFGLLTHGDSREKRRTLVNQVKGYLESSGTYDEEKEKVFDGWVTKEENPEDPENPITTPVDENYKPSEDSENKLEAVWKEQQEDQTEVLNGETEFGETEVPDEVVPETPPVPETEVELNTVVEVPVVETVPDITM